MESTNCCWDTRIDKLEQISKYILEQFYNALDKLLVIHDIDIRKWALKTRSSLVVSPVIYGISEVGAQFQNEIQNHF